MPREGAPAAAEATAAVRLLEVAHVAHRLRFSVEHVRELLRSKQLPAIKLGTTRWRVDPRDLEAYIDRCRVNRGGARAPGENLRARF